MLDFQRGITSLIKSAILNTKEILPNNFDFEQAYKLGRKHQILPILYYGIINSGIDIDSNLKTQFENATMQNILVNQNQMYLLNALFDRFEKENISYMPLKGTILKSVYPKPEMRPMGDADILIKLDEYEKIKGIMEEFSFQEKYESDHELAWSKGVLTIELHKRMIPSYNKDYSDYFGDGWKLANRISSDKTRYAMAPNDELIYNFTHMAKHYREGGIGIRHILDIYVCFCLNGEVDFSYIEQELKKLQLWDFFTNVINTVKVWFYDEKATDITDFITDYIFSSGSFGTRERKSISSLTRVKTTAKKGQSSKFARAFKTVFWPYKNMSYIYPILKKYPVLLPVFWIVRLFKGIFLKKDTVAKHINGINRFNDNDVNQFRSDLEVVGLGFNFKQGE